MGLTRGVRILVRKTLSSWHTNLMCSCQVAGSQSQMVHDALVSILIAARFNDLQASMPPRHAAARLRLGRRMRAGIGSLGA